MKRTYRNVLDEAVRQHVNDEIDLYPRILARLQTRSDQRGLRARPAIVVLAALLALSLLSGVVYAVSRSLGYIPGVGIVEQGAVLRILAEPIVVEREGITLTVTQGLASPEKTVINYQVENIPEAALARGLAEGGTPAPSCSPSDQLRLPDGTTFSPNGGQGRGWGTGFQLRDTFDPLPADVNRATLVVSCLLDSAPGLAPEHWEVPLVFVPAPPDMTVVPVIEITPSPPPTKEAGGESAFTPDSGPISIDRSIELDDGYILIGSFHSIITADGLTTSPHVWSLRITDAGGNDVPYDYTSDIDLPVGDEDSSAWAYKIVGRSHVWPLTLTVDTLEAPLSDPGVSFDFDTGPSPQAEQRWSIDRDLQFGGHTLHVIEALRTSDGYAFSFQGDPTITGVGVDIRGSGAYIPPAGGGGGGGDNALSASLAYTGQIPQGKLTVVVNRVTIRVPGPWSIKWEPEGTVSQAPANGPLAAAACVTDEAWAQARASGPGALPAGLPGRFVLFGPNADRSTYGVSVFDPADASRRFLGEGSWPIASPDGTKIIYTGSNGLVVADLVHGEATSLPGTDPTDYRMVWSPDSSRIAFIRSGTNQIMRIDVDGSDQRQVRDNSAVYHALVGWADETHLLITVPSPGGVDVQSLDLVDGSTQVLFTLSSNKADTVISSDGRWIAFTTSLGGMQGNGLYVSHLDGSERRFVAAIDGRALYFPIWSPDNGWLILSLPDPDDPIDQSAQALVNLESCRVIRLPDLGGEVYSWGR